MFLNYAHASSDTHHKVLHQVIKQIIERRNNLVQIIKKDFKREKLLQCRNSIKNTMFSGNGRFISKNENN